ncbi:MAG: DUF448 domain-containing protein [Geobacteraceae bacterium]|mgnify:FL=1|nr:DUF448 domain-containing protein [Geobacteraceae bacterium]
MAKESPRRTCVGCRSACDKDELIRFVLAPDGTLVPDLMQKLPGRGVYTCLKEDCIRQACERKQFSRAFKTDVQGVDPEALRDRIRAVMEDRIGSYISLANKAGKIVSGSDMVGEVLKKYKDTPKILLLASDVSEDIGNRMRCLATHCGVESVTLFDKERYGALLGKSPRSVVAVQGQGFVDKLKMEITRYRNFLRGEGCAG